MSTAKPQGKAHKHHFLPECYLKGWIGPEGHLVEYAQRYRGVQPRWTAPGGTGYALDLYAMPALGKRSDALENRLMSMIDSAAATALARMRGGDPLDLDARTAFATLLTTLLTRTPASIAILKSKLAEWRVKDRPDTQAIYERFIWRPGMPARAAEVYAATDTEEDVQNFLAETLTLVLTHDRIIAFLSAMTWQVLTMPTAAQSLLTGDQPIITSNGLEAKDSFLSLPIGPRQLFLATRSKLEAARFVQRAGLLKIARRSNRLIVERARRFAYAANEDLSEFVAARFGSNPVQTIGEKMAMKDPWGAGRPPEYGPDNAIEDYVDWVRTQVETARDK